MDTTLPDKDHQLQFDKLLNQITDLVTSRLDKKRTNLAIQKPKQDFPEDYSTIFDETVANNSNKKSQDRVKSGQQRNPKDIEYDLRSKDNQKKN